MCKVERFGNWIFTYTGGRFYPLDPRVEDINIEDIAHALSLICRFNGHIEKMYCVAQHSIHVSQLCNPENALWGLLHDAAEIYLADIPRPLKMMFSEYKDKERAVQRVICDKFGLPYDEPRDVKDADNIMLATEMRDLMPNFKGTIGFIPREEKIIPMTSELAEKMFLDRIKELII